MTLKTTTTKRYYNKKNRRPHMTTTLSYSEAREYARDVHSIRSPLLGSNTKLEKQSPRMAGLILRCFAGKAGPVQLSSGRTVNTCPKASPYCLSSCLGHTAGRNRFDKTQEAQQNRVRLLFENPDIFMCMMYKELTNLVNYCEKRGKKPVVRLNNCTDIVWERKHPDIFRDFPTIQFYDYTKIYRRGPEWMKDPLDFPENYHLTFSRSENNWHECEQWLSRGGLAAVVMRGCHDKPIPKSYMGWPTVPGDVDDGNWMDPPGHIRILTVKGGPKVLRDGGDFFVPYGDGLTALTRNYKIIK